MSLSPLPFLGNWVEEQIDAIFATHRNWFGYGLCWNFVLW